MLIVPDSSVSLYADVPISDGHEILFRSKTEQSTYFATKRIASKAGCTYMRKTGRIRIEWSTSEVLRADFISFKNPSFENITFYAKLIDYEYVNNVTTDCIYEIDWFQSFCFDVDYHACSILREHLTEEDYQKAVANPWRHDIPELLTDEGLPVSELQEIIYPEETHEVSEDNYFINPDRVKIPTFLDDNKNGKVIMLICSQFDIDEWKPEDKSNFLKLYNLRAEPEIFHHFPIATTTYVYFETNTQTDTPIKRLGEALKLMTVYGDSSNIVGIYFLPKWMYDAAFTNNSNPHIRITINKDNTINPKLNNYPFEYLRVKNPDGDVKNYLIDRFYENSHSDNLNYAKTYFTLSANFNGLPSMTLAPEDYNYSGLSQGSTSPQANYYERIDFNNFPQMAYSIDCYLTFLSTQYNNMIASGTAAGTFSRYGNLISNAVGAVGNIASLGMFRKLTPDDKIRSNFVGIPSNQKNVFNKDNFYNNNNAFNNSNLLGSMQDMSLMSEAEQPRGDFSSGIFDMTKGAYTNDTFVPGSTTGYLPYHYDELNFTAEVVKLERDVLDKYSTFLDIYGYKSLRNGVPHVCNYMKDGSNTPHFNTFDNEKFTYVMTENMHVTGALQVACRAIENLFNAGCRFLKVVE